jgi:hypothetical protein
VHLGKIKRTGNTVATLTLSPISSQRHRYGRDSALPLAAVNPSFLPPSLSPKPPPPSLLLSLAFPPSLNARLRRRRLPRALAAVAQHGALRLRLRRRASGEGRRRRRGQAEAPRALRGHGPAGPGARAAPEVPLLRRPLGALPPPPPSPPPALRRLALHRQRKVVALPCTLRSIYLIFSVKFLLIGRMPMRWCRGGWVNNWARDA